MRKTLGQFNKASVNKKFNERQNDIVIKDWAGSILFQGNCDHGSEINRVLKANKCKDCKREIKDDCPKCNGTGYSGDFSVYWVSESDERNVYEYINY